MNQLTQKRKPFYGKKLTLNSNQLDLSIFHGPSSNCYKLNKSTKHSVDDIPITENCSQTTRLCTASLYAETLRKSTKLNEAEKKSLFVEFNEKVYESLIDDMVHFIKVHDDDIKKVHSEWTEQYGVSKCSFNECIQRSRQYRRGRRDTREPDKNSEFGFYQALYDQIHNYIFHLFDMGLRVDTKSSDDSKAATVNKVNANETMAEQSKYTIQAVTEQKGVTQTDAMIEGVVQKDIGHKQMMQRLHHFLNEDHFDSDAVEMDLEDITDSNLYSVLQNKSVAETMMNTIQSVKLVRRAFSTGFRFNYRDESHEMYVKPKYRNLKEEIFESGYIKKASEWREFIDLKGKKYWKSNTVRKMIENGMMRHYELTLEHLFVITLYCDFTDLCTEFSATYRRKHVFEIVASVISRHSKYAHFGQLLEEMVNHFGISRKKGNGAQDAGSGPFYTGINCVLNIGTFAITLKGPTSTSTALQTAKNFAKEDGMILKLNNDSSGVDEQRYFDCSWMSGFGGNEAERLWMAVSEERPLRLVSITNMSLEKSYWKQLNSLYLFDAMISGVDQGDKFKKKQNEADYALISKLMGWTLKDENVASSGVDAYFEKEWNLFRQSKTAVHLNLSLLDHYYPSLWKLAIFNLTRNADYRWNKPAEGMDNVFRSDFAAVFPSLRTLNIDILYGRYRFRWEALLESTRSISPLVTIIICDKSEWIGRALNEGIVKEFDAAGWEMEYKEKKLILKSKNL